MYDPLESESAQALFGRWIEIPVNHHPEKVARSPNATTRHYSKAMRVPSDPAREKLLSGWNCSDIFLNHPDGEKGKENKFLFVSCFFLLLGITGGIPLLEPGRTQGTRKRKGRVEKPRPSYSYG
jgi:hypothetical protein